MTPVGLCRPGQNTFFKQAAPLQGPKAPARRGWCVVTSGSKAPHPSPLPKGEGIDRGALKNSAILPPLPLGEGKGRTRLSLLFAALLFTPLAHAFDLLDDDAIIEL